MGVEVDFLKELIQYESFDLVVGGCEGVGCMIYSTKRNENLIIDFKHPNKAAQILNANNENTISAFYYSWGKLFRNSIISQNDLRFDTRMKICEDTCFLMKYLIHVQKIILSDSSLYRYRLLSVPNKYVIDSDCYRKHMDLFDYCLSEFESFSLRKMTILRKKIYTALLLQFLANLKRINSYSRFKQEIYAFNYGFTYILEIEIELNRIKRWAYWFIFKHTILGYYFIRLILTIKTILK